MKIASALPATVLALLAQPGQAQPLRPAADEAVEHTGSGWVFPKHVGDYTRGSDPECIAGTANDCGANYEDSRAMAATVYVYPDDSPAADASYAGAKAVIEQDLEQQPFAQAWSEGPFRVGSARPLVGEKIFYKIGIGADSTQTSLYFFDTGRWIVKIRISGRTTDASVFRRTDDFVRAQPWDSLDLGAQACTGSACRTERPLAIHGSTPEMLASLLVDQALEEVFPKDLPPCDAVALAAALAAEPRKRADGAPEPVEAVAACSPRRGVKTSFVRLSLSSDVLSKIELDSPDGLSLRGPLSFAVVAEGRSGFLTELRDGMLDEQDAARLIEALDDEARADFATANGDGKHPQLTPRFLR